MPVDSLFDILMWCLKGLVAMVLGWFGYKIKTNDELNAKQQDEITKQGQEIAFIKEQLVSKEEIREIINEEVKDELTAIKDKLNCLDDKLTDVRIKQAKVEAFQEVVEARAKTGS